MREAAATGRPGEWNMAEAGADEMTHVEPGGQIPVWPLGWANIWIDDRGGMHWSRYTHGSTFDSVFEKIHGRPVGRDETCWMLDAVGSVGDAGDDDYNPGLQLNELAVKQLGWVLVKAHGLGSEPDLAVTFDGKATREALSATVRLLRSQPKGARVEVLACEGFAEAVPPGKAIKEIREWAGEAPAAAERPPTWAAPQRRGY